MYKNIYFKVFIIGFFTIILFSAFSFSKKNKELTETAKKKVKKSPLVTLSPVTKKDIFNTLQLTGTIEPVKIASMASPAEGPIVGCFVREGDSVKKGQVMVLVGRKSAALADVKAAKEELNKQKDEFNSIKKLVKSGAVPGDQLNTAKANLEKAKALLAKAETQIEDYSIVAPWSGIISKVFIAEGNYIAPRAKLVEMFSPKSLVLRFDIPEEKSGRLKKGLAVKAKIDAFNGKEFEGHLVRVYPELDRETRTRTVEATLNNCPGLFPGMFVRVELTLNNIKNAIIVPESAVLVNTNGEDIVFVINEKKVILRKVKTGLEINNMVQIISGVTLGEKVVVSGNEHLKNNMVVRLPKKKQEPKNNNGLKRK